MSRVISRVRADSPQMERLQRSIGASYEEVRRSPLHSGLQIDGIVLLANTDYVLEHTLGRALAGWWVVRKNADANPFESPTVNNAPENTLILRSAVAVTVSVWVY